MLDCAAWENWQPLYQTGPLVLPELQPWRACPTFKAASRTVSRCRLRWISHELFTGVLCWNRGQNRLLRGRICIGIGSLHSHQSERSYLALIRVLGTGSARGITNLSTRQMGGFTPLRCFITPPEADIHVIVRLFAQFGAPEYHILLGAADPEFMASDAWPALWR